MYKEFKPNNSINQFQVNSMNKVKMQVIYINNSCFDFFMFMKKKEVGIKLTK